MPDRRSSPDLHRSLGGLYPTALDSDPKELAQQSTELFTQHARAHERNLVHAIALNERLVDVEDAARKLDERDDRIEKAIVDGLTSVQRTVAESLAAVKLDQAIERTKIRTTIAVVGASGGALALVIEVLLKLFWK